MNVTFEIKIILTSSEVIYYFHSSLFPLLCILKSVWVHTDRKYVLAQSYLSWNLVSSEIGTKWKESLSETCHMNATLWVKIVEDLSDDSIGISMYKKPDGRWRRKSEGKYSTRWKFNLIQKPWGRIETHYGVSFAVFQFLRNLIFSTPLRHRKPLRYIKAIPRGNIIVVIYGLIIGENSYSILTVLSVQTAIG